MKAFVVIAMLLGLSPLAAVAAPHQTLSIVLHASDASTQRLSHYRVAAPIAVKVAGDARRFDAVTLTANGPDGIAISTPLARTDDGFQGALRLVKTGAWTINLTTQLGSATRGVAAISLDVVAPDGVEAGGYAGLAFAAMLTVTGVFVLLRRDVFATALATIRATKRS